jgi:hypothetical protein
MTVPANGAAPGIVTWTSSRTWTSACRSAVTWAVTTRVVPPAYPMPSAAAARTLAAARSEQPDVWKQLRGSVDDPSTVGDRFGGLGGLDDLVWVVWVLQFVAADT